MASVEVMEQLGVTIADQALVTSIAVREGRNAANANDDDRAAAYHRALTIRFIRGTNAQHNGYLTHLRNNFLDGNDNYPSRVHDAYNILQRREDENRQVIHTNDAVSFVSEGDDNTKQG